MGSKIENSSTRETPLAPECSICLEQVFDNGTQAIAKLKCGHTFHMSCIGCEFNIRGIMQCPNCRMIENSDWLFCMGAPADLDIITQDTNMEMATADENQNQNIFQRPHGVRNFPGYQRDDHGSLPVIRPRRAIQIGGNGNAVVFLPDVRTNQHRNLAPILPPPAPQSSHFHASNATEIGRIDRLRSCRPPLILGSDVSAHFHGAFGVHESTLLRLFPPYVARDYNLYGLDPPPPPPPSIQARIAPRGPYWVPPRVPNLVGLEPSVFNQGSSRASLSTDPLQPNLTSLGTSMEQGPFNFGATNPENVP